MNHSRDARRNKIREIVRESPIRTQRALVVALRDAGFACTQATVSRDIAEMGLSKLPDGHYILSGDLRLLRMMADLALSVVAVKNLVLVKASPGTANAITAALDGAGIPEVMGTIAGDDTILIVTKTDEAGEALASHLDRLRRAA